MKYRIYVDEVGNADLQHADHPLHRYLSLTGIIIDLAYVANTASPRLEQLKQHFFGSHPDEPVILHRKELVNRKPPFEVLRDPQIEMDFNDAILKLLRELMYLVITVVIDKKEHRDLYKVWRYDAYHYSLAVLLERYIHFLERQHSLGDVMAESRGGREDRRLKQSFARLYADGSDYVTHERFVRSLTSSQLKVTPKANNIAGLQIADLIAHASQKHILQEKGRFPHEQATFGDQIVQILLDEKYYRSEAGKIEGFGEKLLP